METTVIKLKKLTLNELYINRISLVIKEEDDGFDNLQDSKMN
jgi:hypothetical protein